MAKEKVVTVTFENLIPPYKDGVHYNYFEDAGRHPFRYDSKKFELANAWWLAEIATFVYDDPQSVKNLLTNRAGFGQVRSIIKDGTECFVASNDNFVVVAFRGTETGLPKDNPDPKARLDFRNVLIDLATDVNFLLREFVRGKPEFGKVHHGFRDAFAKVSAELLSHLRELAAQRPARKVWITGHSLGAALATLAAAACAEEPGVAVGGLYTFGSPLVGDKTFTNRLRETLSARFQIEYYRFVNNRDIVTTVPPEGIYRHAGSLRFIDGDGGIRNSPPRLRWLANLFKGVFSLSLDGFGRVNSKVTKLIPDGLEHHVPMLYAAHVGNALVKSGE
jgi:triacylglycerol lipase